DLERGAAHAEVLAVFTLLREPAQQVLAIFRACSVQTRDPLRQGLVGLLRLREIALVKQRFGDGLLCSQRILLAPERFESRLSRRIAALPRQLQSFPVLDERGIEI